MEKTIHHGRNINDLEKCSASSRKPLPSPLDEDWNQKKLSLLEQKEVAEEPLLQEVAKGLKVPAEAIKNFDEEAAINIIGNTVNNVNDNTTEQIFQFNSGASDITKWVEALDEIKLLNLALLNEKDKKIELLQQILNRENSVDS